MLRDIIIYTLRRRHKFVFKSLLCNDPIQNYESRTKKVTAWLTANKLSLNISKTNFIIFKSNRKKLKSKANVIINKHTIDQVKYTKFLGIYIDEELSWKYHIYHIASKSSKMTGIMAEARLHLTTKTLLTLYHTMIYPYLNYCNNIWGSTYPTRSLYFQDTEENCKDYDLLKL